MDPDIREALTDIKKDVREGFRDQAAKIQELVTQGEFRATVERIDAQHATLRRDFDSHEAGAPKHRQAAHDRADAVRTEIREDLEGFRTTTRWAIGLSATGAGVLVALLSWLFKNIPL